MNEISLRRLEAAVRPGSGASIELVYAGRRTRIACGADKAYLRALIAAVGPDSGARIEVVFATCAGNPAL